MFHKDTRFILIILASLEECPGRLCHNPTVRVLVGFVDKNFNLGHNFPTFTDRYLILHLYIPCEEGDLVTYF